MVTSPTQVMTALSGEATRERETERRNNWIENALLAAITLFAAILRLHAISARTFWFDEAVGAEISRLPWRELGLALWNREANMAFYYVLLRYWSLLGKNEGILRGLSVLFAVATIPIIFALGARLFNRKTGFLAAWLLSINAYHVCYGQEARAYSLVVFLASCATLLLVKNLQEPASAKWGSYTAICVLTVYSHFFGGLVILAHCVSLLFLKRSDVAWREFLRSMIRFSFFMIPIAIFVARAGSGPLNWIQKTRSETVLHFFVCMAGNKGLWLVALDAIAVLVTGLRGIHAWGKKGRAWKTWSPLLVSCWLAVPFFVVLGASVRMPLFVPRYLIPSLPALILLVAAGITHIRPTAFAWLLFSAISLGSIAGTGSYYKKDFDIERDDWRAATSLIFDHAHPRDDVFFYLNFGRIPFEYYRSIRRPLPEWPRPLDVTDNTSLTHENFRFVNFGESLSKARPAGDRVWLVLLYDTDPDGKPNRASIVSRAVFGNGRRLVEQKSFSGITVLLFSRDPEDNPQNPTFEW
jgi:mannosyltransferase